jgi:hypothetical protein
MTELPLWITYLGSELGEVYIGDPRTGVVHDIWECQQGIPGYPVLVASMSLLPTAYGEDEIPILAHPAYDAPVYASCDSRFAEVEGLSGYLVMPTSEGTVVIDPEPDILNAPWNLDGPGGPWSGNGDSTMEHMTPGDYILTWGGVEGWNVPSPNPQSRILMAGGMVTFSGTYTEIPAEVGDWVWEDTNRNGIQDAGEIGIPSVSVTLYDCNDTFVENTLTSPDGYYGFAGIVPGDYYLHFSFSTPESGTWVFSPMNIGDDAYDSDVNPTTGMTDCFTLNPGEVNSTVDAGAYLDLSGVDEPALPLEVVLHQNAPNPFNPMTTIRYELPAPRQVTLHIYDVSGHLIRVLKDAVCEDAGQHEAIWHGKDDSGRSVASGTYFYRLTAGGYTETKRMTLVR